MPKSIIISDTFDFRSSSREYLDNGFLRVTGKAARTGVYQYLASELGLNDREPNSIVNVYRPPSEVFNQDSLASYANVDVTNDHPNTMVDSKTYKSVSVGHVLDATQNGDFVDLTMIIKAEGAIKDVESGKSQLSPGYTAVYEEGKGVSPNGESYDFKQTEIEINHVAIVSRGRGGDQVRINDQIGEITMPVMLTLDSGRSVDVADAANATLVADAFDTLKNKLIDSAKSVSTMSVEVEKKQAALDAAIEDLAKLKLESSDEAISAKIQEIASVKDSAVKFAGSEFTCDSVNVVEIQRAALKVKRPAIDWAIKSDAYVESAFELAIDWAADAPNTQYQQLAFDAITPVEPAKLSAYDAYVQNSSNAWKGTVS